VEVAICLLFVAYLAPFVVAARRDHERLGAILAVNLLLGWTGIGWLLALRWARHPTPPPEPPAVRLRRGHLRLLEPPVGGRGALDPRPSRRSAPRRGAAGRRSTHP
jgi:hypothetical protein